MPDKVYAPVAALHVATLSGFAFAQPLYDLLGRNAEFLVAHQCRPSDLLLLVAAVSFVLPAMLTLVLVVLCPRSARRIVLAGVAGLLAALVAVQAGNRFAFVPVSFVVGLGAFAGVCFGLAYWRYRVTRTFLTVLSPAVVVFPALFLVNPSVPRILRPESEVGGPRIETTTPVVLLVFDEFPLTSLLDEHDRIDPGRFPNLAALARDATWFRNGTSVSYVTTSAVPAILTGNYPREHALPTRADHPRNLFTFLGGSYELRVFESVTNLCPERLTGKDRIESRQHWKSLAVDLALVELHLLVPRGWRNRLPSISQGWSGFGNGCPCCVLARQEDDRPGQFRRFLDAITPSERPTLYFLHAIMPHSPFRFLPDGTRYGIDTGLECLSADGSWPDEEEPVLRAQQRHLLQACYADCLLGQVIARLRAAGVYDRALVIVTADHGISFVPGQPYRHASPITCADILRVPFLVKQPHQACGETSDRNVQTIDILPTIADVLGAPLPWPVDGQSVFPVQNEPAQKVFFDQDGRRVYDRNLGGDRGGLGRKFAVFGSGSVDSLYRIADHAELIGKSVDPYSSIVATEMVGELDDVQVFARVNAADGFVPASVRGTLQAPKGVGLPATLAVAINGTIQATCRTYGQEGKSARWSALVPATAFRDRHNDVALFRVFPVGLGEPSLQRIPLRGTNEPAPAGDTQSFVGRDGKPLRIVSRRLAGCVDQLRRTDGCLEIAGWAADRKNGELPESILVYAGGKLLYAGRSNSIRADVALSLGNAALERAGFAFSLPLEWLRSRDDAEVRVFAVACDGVACELSRWR